MFVKTFIELLLRTFRKATTSITGTIIPSLLQLMAVVARTCGVDFFLAKCHSSEFHVLCYRTYLEFFYNVVVFGFLLAIFQ